MPHPPYVPDERVAVQLDKAFTYHASKDDQAARYCMLREKFKELALFVATSTPSSREQSVAFTKLEEAMFFSVAAIARNE